MKHFIKVTYAKSPANKLQEGVQKAINELDQTLWPNLDQAKFMVYQKFDDAVASYTGRCTMARPIGRQDYDHVYMIYAEVANIAIYIAKKDFTHCPVAENIKT